MNDLIDAPVGSVKGVGEKTEKVLNSIGVYTLRDILLYFPRGYEQFPPLTDPDGVRVGEKCAIYIRVSKPVRVNQYSKLRTATLETEGRRARLTLIWFRSPYIRSAVKLGGLYVFYGNVSERGGRLYMDQPRVFSLEEYGELENTLQPLYALTKGLTNARIMKIIRGALERAEDFEDYLEADEVRRLGLEPYAEALSQIHFPQSKERLYTARKRFAFDEFLFFIIAMQLSKEKSVDALNGFKIKDSSFSAELIGKLPYPLTGAQSRVLGEIMSDMAGECPMQRLVQGDVGSGKTIIAFLAMLEMAHAGHQAAIMAPTEVLARQHFDNLTKLVDDFGLEFKTVLLTGSMSAKDKRTAYYAISNETPLLVVGTHALLQEGVEFKDLGLVITDEQHRFGVRQRGILKEKGKCPHFLVMSATPIPRTLALILYGDLSISAVDEMPARRLATKNCVVGTDWRKNAYNFILREVHAGHQAYIICPLADESEEMDGENVIDYSEKLRDILDPDIAIGTLNGRMKPAEKDRIMELFKKNEIQVLVSTTVVEVGVDVPNATVMMIENAERFGLAQLHQLRGRVGRGEAQSYCIFMEGKPKADDNPRLKILGQTNDGFKIAEEDLKLRGPGDFLGIRQSGEFSFRVADVFQDADMLRLASDYAKEVCSSDPGLEKPEHAGLRDKISENEGAMTL